MNDDLKNIIPRREETTLEQIKDPSPVNYTAIFVTIIFLIAVGFAIYGLTVVYKNYVVNNSTTSQEDLFLKNSKNCVEDSYLTTQESTTFFMMYLNQDLNYRIKGLNEDEKCVIEIEVIDANMTYNQEDIINYINKEENKDAVYYQYLMLTSLGDDTVDESIFERVATDEEKNAAIEELIILINEDYEKNPREGTENTEGLIGNVEVCIFDNLEDIDDFVSRKIKGTAIPHDISMSYTGNVGKSISTYKNVTCTTVSE